MIEITLGYEVSCNVTSVVFSMVFSATFALFLSELGGLGRFHLPRKTLNRTDRGERRRSSLRDSHSAACLWSWYLPPLGDLNH